MRIFVTGVQGYIGSLLAPYLAERGHDVTGFDTGFYQDGWLYTDTKNRSAFPKLVWGDIRKITAENLAGYDAVVHLAELSNDPLSPSATHA
jgi:nucleoside-diphosphate-sugar epimerase